MDLHLHTPGSIDYQDSGATTLDILRKAEERGLDIIAFTDHNSVRGWAEMWRDIEDLELLEYLARMTPAEQARLAELRRLLGKILVLPGFEFTATFGFHVLAIFPETTSIRMMEHLLLTLGVPEDKFGSGEVGATTDVLKAYEILADHGALVIGAHVNSTHGVAMQGLRFGGQTKIAYTQDPHLHALEVTDLDSASRRSTAYFFSGVKAEYPRRMHCIQGSDAHRLDRDPNRDTNLGVGDRATEVQLPERSFAALKTLLQSSDWRAIRPARAGGPEAAALHAAREEGESATAAFHEKASQARIGYGHALRDVVAMANGAGGSIYLGVGPIDRKAIPGLPNAKTVVEELTAEILREITPPVETSLEVIAYEGKSVLAVRVPPGTARPYALNPGHILVRHGRESVPASRDEIVAMVRGEALPTAAPQQVPQPAPRPQNGQPPQQRPAPQPVPQAQQRPAFAQPQPAAEPRPQQQRPPKPAPGRKPEAERIELPTEDGGFDDISPRAGVEILDVTGEGDNRRYVMRDLRNGQITRDVPHNATRRLWHYAIQQRELKSLDAGHIRWKGDFGFWKVCRLYRGEKRYNVAWRTNGKMRVFYGVNEDAMDDRWKAVLPAPRGTDEGEE